MFPFSSEFLRFFLDNVFFMFASVFPFSSVSVVLFHLFSLLLVLETHFVKPEMGTDVCERKASQKSLVQTKFGPGIIHDYTANLLTSWSFHCARKLQLTHPRVTRALHVNVQWLPL